MMRAIIGTVAVLAGFAVVETSSGASTSLAGSCKAVQAYALLQPGERIPVRAEPTPGGAVVGTLAAKGAAEGAAASFVTLTGSQSGWVRIILPAQYPTGDATGGDSGWIPADRLAVDTRLDGEVTLYTRPDLLGSATARLHDHEQRFRVLGCRDAMLRVINAEQGNVWIDRWCARPEGCQG